MIVVREIQLRLAAEAWLEQASRRLAESLHFRLSDVSMGGGVWKAEDVPILLNAFEHIARNALLNWWASLAAASSSSVKT
jgi:hypothetical protein